MKIEELIDKIIAHTLTDHPEVVFKSRDTILSLCAAKDDTIKLLDKENKILFLKVAELEDLLVSARAIAERKGENTAWERFSERIASFGIGSVTPRVFKILPSDTIQKQPDYKIYIERLNRSNQFAEDVPEYKKLLFIYREVQEALSKLGYAVNPVDYDTLKQIADLQSANAQLEEENNYLLEEIVKNSEIQSQLERANKENRSLKEDNKELYDKGHSLYTQLEQAKKAVEMVKDIIKENEYWIHSGDVLPDIDMGDGKPTIKLHRLFTLLTEYEVSHE